MGEHPGHYAAPATRCLKVGASRFAGIFAALVLAFGIGECSDRSQDQSTKQKSSASAATDRQASGSEVRLPIVASTAVDTLDPIQSVEAVQYTLDAQIFEGLVAVYEKASLVPALAQEWSSTPDLRIWRFKLREAYFQDDACFPDGKGRRVIASDVVFSLSRGLDPKAGSKGSWALSSYIAGADDFSKGKANRVEGLRAIDNQTVEIELVRGDQYFLSRLTFSSAFVTAPEAVEKYREQFGLHPVGTGPYRLGSWKPGQEMIFERNPSFGRGAGWQPTLPSVDRVRIVFYRSEAQVSAAFDSGELAAREVFGADVARISGERPDDELAAAFPKARVVRPGPFTKVHLLAAAIGPGHAFGSDPFARRALSNLFPRDRLGRDVLRGTGTPLARILPPTILRDPAAPHTLDNPAAVLKSRLKGKSVRIAYVSTRVNDIIIALLKEILEEAKAEVVLFPNTSVNALFASLATSRPDLTLIYWQPVFPNVPEYLTALLKSARPVPNFTGYGDDRVDAAVAALRATTDEGRRKVLQDKLMSVLDETMPWSPLYYETPIVLVSPKLNGYAFNAVGVVQFSHLSLTPRVDE